MAEKPFIVKGIMTVAGAKKALEAGAAGIVVSNHGGRVLDQCPATAEVLPAIVDAVGGQMTILVDGGIRTGMDVFKALALGADAVLIGRPFVTMVYGAGAEGVKTYVEKLKAELADTMAMCGAPPRRPTPPPPCRGSELCSRFKSQRRPADGRRFAVLLFQVRQAGTLPAGPPPPAAPACGTSALRPPPQSGGSHSGRQRPPRSPGPSDGPGRRTGWPWASATGGQGWVRTYRRYSQERVWPNVVGMRPSRASRSSLTPAQPIILRIRASMSTTGERNSAPPGARPDMPAGRTRPPGWSRRAPPGPICPAAPPGRTAAPAPPARGPEPRPLTPGPRGRADPR